MVERQIQEINDRLLDAYYEYVIERVRAGIIDHSMDAEILDGMSVDEHIVKALRAAGRLPEGWDSETDADVTPAPPQRRVS